MMEEKEERVHKIALFLEAMYGRKQENNREEICY